MTIATLRAGAALAVLDVRRNSCRRAGCARARKRCDAHRTGRRRPRVAARGHPRQHRSAARLPRHAHRSGDQGCHRQAGWNPMPMPSSPAPRPRRSTPRCGGMWATPPPGLFEVTPNGPAGGFDVSNMTVIRGQTGWIVIDPLTSVEAARAAMDLVNATLGARPVSAVLYSHSHGDHFGEQATTRRRSRPAPSR